MLKRVRTRILLVNGLIFLVAGCATAPPVAKFQIHGANTYELHTEKDGLVIAVHPITDAAELKQAFGINLVEQGLLPVLFVAENHNASTSFIISKEKVFVLNKDASVSSNSQRNEVTTEKWGEDARGGSALSALASGGLIGLLRWNVERGMVASDLEHNLADKEFYSRTLDPGEKAAGFVYFQFQKGTPPSGEYRVVAQIKNSATGEVTPFDFKMNLDLVKP